MEARKNAMHRRLCESLRTLMTRSLFEKITIKQICDEAGVIRATFYNYFDDKYDCLNAIVHRDVTTNLTEITQLSQAEERLQAFLETIEANLDFYRSAYLIQGQNSFEEMVRNNFYIIFIRYLDQSRNYQFMSQFSNEMLAKYYAENFSFLLREFVNQKEQLSSKEVIDYALGLLKCSFQDFVEEK